MAQVSSPDSPSNIVKVDHDDDIMQYYVVDGIRLPPFCRGKMEEILNFPVRNDDVWILSYPRAGAWVQDLIYVILEGGEISKLDMSVENLEDNIPFLEAPSPGLETLKHIPSPRIIKSHLPYNLLPTGVKEKRCKIVYLARNPKDVICSFFDFHRTVRMVNYKGTFSQFFYRFINNKLGYGSYFDHVVQWWNQRGHDNVYFLKFEDVKKDFMYAVQQLGEFLEHPISHDSIQEAKDYWEDEPGYNRREDRVGFWKYYFTVHMNEKFDKLLPERMYNTDLDFEYTQPEVL